MGPTHAARVGLRPPNLFRFMVKQAGVAVDSRDVLRGVENVVSIAHRCGVATPASRANSPGHNFGHFLSRRLYLFALTLAYS
jgi:hypothetical protein